MFLDTREAYAKECNRLFKMSIKKLETLIGELFIQRFEEHNIEVEAQYRLAGWVLNQKTKQNSLIYHLKNSCSFEN